MGVLQEFEAKQRDLERLKKELDNLESDPRYTRDKRFLTSLEGLMREFQKTPKAVLAELDENPHPPSKKQRQSKAPMKYRNPHTGVEIEAKTKANRQLKTWIKDHGEWILESWRVS
ncbi:hypothetical protein [Halomonas sp. 3A7M]|uniref:hypothetical protein n=1 Tax=Halomonas sp. 3A7M TaxID=2742616 RepID=UPI001865FC38|nr:hypothetical protein [Halomonas sp. 3A7M]